MRQETPYFKTCIQDELALRCEKNPRYSLRALAKAFGIPAGALSQILGDKRVPSYKMAKKIVTKLGLQPQQEEKFLASLAETHRNRGLRRLNPIFRKLKVEIPPKDLSIDLFRVIGDWYHYAIMMLTYVQDFKPDTRWIAAQLQISPMEAKLAIERLLSLGLLKRENDTLVCWNGHFTTADKHLTTPALKNHTKQVLQKAIESVENDSLEIRSHTYMAMAIDPLKISEAKKLIEEFTNKMSTLLETEPRTQVYEFGVYLYPLQKKQN